MTHETQWISLSPDDMWFERDELGYSVSPLVFDMPMAVRAIYSSKDLCLKIEVHYDSSDEKRMDVVSGPFTFTLGVASGRMHALKIQLEGSSVGALRTAAEQNLINSGRALATAIQAANHEFGRPGEMRSKLNTELAGRIMNQERANLVRAVA